MSSDPDGGVYWEVVSISADGRYLLSIPNEGDPVVLAIQNRRRVAKLHYRDEAEMVGAISPDGAYAAVGYEQSGVKIWSLEGRKVVARPSSTKYAEGVAFSPNGATLAVACGNRLRLYETQKRQATRTYLGTYKQEKGEGPARISITSFSPSGRYLATVEQLMVSGARTVHYSTVVIRDSATGKRVLTIPDLEDVSAIAFSDDSRSLVLAANHGVGISPYAAVYDVRTGRKRIELTPDGESMESVSSLVVGPSGKWVAAAFGSKEVIVWSQPKGVVLKRYTDDSPSPAVRKTVDEMSECFVKLIRKRRQLLAAGVSGDKLRVWNLFE